MRRIALVGGFPSFVSNDNYDINENNYFFDEELDAKFEELFNQNNNSDIEKIDYSLLIKKLHTINKKKFINDMFYKIESHNDIEENTDNSSNKNDLFSKTDRKWKHFTIPNRFNAKTLIFLVKEQADPVKNIAYFSTELLDYTEEKQVDNSIEQTFYIKRKYFNEYPIILLHIDYTQKSIYINNGILDHDIVRISKEPQFFPYDSIVLEEYNSFGINSQNPISDEKKEFTFSTKISGSLATIIDIEKCKPVPRETYFDEKDKIFKTNIRLQQKKYFVFKIKGNDCFYWKLSNLEIGHNYRCGSGGYPKNCIKAAVYLENDSSAEALYEIAQIFLNDTYYGDETEGKKYLKQAADQGNSLAWIEYILRFNYQKTSKELLVNHGITNNEMFIKAMLLEKEGALKDAFELYFSLADKKYKFANLRLGSDTIVESEKKELYERYILSAKNDDGRIEYCIYLLCDYLFLENNEIGFTYLKLAADKGHKFAIYDIAEAYNEGIDVTIDKAKALNYFLLIKEDEKILIKVSNMLIDGVGCEKNAENDKMAFNLLYHASKNSNNSTIFNNLGWMYEKGRGCDIDYCQAKKNYEKAHNLGSIRGTVHLGDMYFNGLGVNKCTITAKKYYKYATEKNDSKAIEKLKMIENKEKECMKKKSQSENPYIFISYAHKDFEKVLPILEKLKTYNINLWYDEGITPGSEWDEFIASKLKLSSIVVAFISNNYLNSRNCRDEIKYARNQEVKMVLVYLENVSLSDGIELRMGMQQAILYYKFDKEEELYNKLIYMDEIANCIEEK